MSYLIKMIFAVCVCAIVCSAQTPEPTPLAPGAVEFYQKSRIEDKKQGIESKEPRLSSNQFVQVFDDNFVITVMLLYHDNKTKNAPWFEVLLGITEKQLGGNEDVFVETMKNQPPNLPTMIIDNSSQPLNFNLSQSGFGKGGFDDIPLYFRDESYKIVLKDEQVEELLRANSIDFTCGRHQFSVVSNDNNSLKNFIVYEREITRLSRIKAKAKR